MNFPKNKLLALTLVAITGSLQASNPNEFEANAEFPFGRANPMAPKQLADYAPLIGSWSCESIATTPEGAPGAPIKMTWKFSYIMNGTAIQDQTLKADDQHSGSIRQFNEEEDKWYVHYYSTTRITSLSTYTGNKQDNDIVLYKTISDVKTPEGIDAYYRLTFSNISENGFSWSGDWVDPSSDPDQLLATTWTINCSDRHVQ